MGTKLLDGRTMVDPVRNPIRIESAVALGDLFLNGVDLGGIEPPPRQCECRVIPLNYRPRTSK